MAKNQQYSRWVISMKPDEWIYVWQNGRHRVNGRIGEMTRWALDNVRKQDDVVFKGFSDKEISVKGSVFLKDGLDVLSKSEESET